VCGLGGDSVVLEIGPGTGQATVALLDRGATVTAVELGPALAERLQTKFEGRSLTVVVDAFEHAPIAGESFDIVVAATSFHWIPPASALPRCAEVLRRRGWLALWWNYFGDPARPDPFHEALVPILQRRAPQLLDAASAGNPGLGAHPYALDTVARITEIEDSGAFGPVQHEIIRWTGRHSAAELRKLFASFSPWLALEPDLRNSVLDDLEEMANDHFNGLVERPYLTPIYLTARRV
jgi:SAM-dependent methyltransferase